MFKKLQKLICENQMNKLVFSSKPFPNTLILEFEFLCFQGEKNAAFTLNPEQKRWLKNGFPFEFDSWFLTVAAVEVCVGAGSAVLWSQVDLWVEVLRHGGVALLTGGLLRV